MSPEPWHAWFDTVRDGIDAGAAPGVAAWLAVDGRVVLHDAHGRAAIVPNPEPLRLDMRFDLASMTKAISTTSCVMALVEDGRLDLDAPLAEVLPELAEHGKGQVTARHLMTHVSGLPAHRRYDVDCADRAAVREAVLATPLVREVGAATEYSCVGFLTLGFALETLSGQRQDEYLRERVLAPLGLADGLGYRPADPAECVPTEVTEDRGLVRGVVHDENACRCDGVAGNAGLFGTVEAAGRFGQAVLDGRLWREATAREVLRVRDDAARESFWLGWKRLTYESGDATAFGHDGFTGTLLWVSPARQLVVALLTNRVHPTRDNRKLYDLRPGWVKTAAELAPK